ncbi:hypothetical protein WA158_001403 [Blastocystis sp. Blastoise]
MAKPNKKKMCKRNPQKECTCSSSSCECEKNCQENKQRKCVDDGCDCNTKCQHKEGSDCNEHVTEVNPEEEEHCECECNHHLSKEVQELNHFRDIQYGLLDYSQYMLLEWRRRSNARGRLPKHQQEMFEDQYFVHQLELFKDCILTNSRFLAKIAMNRNYYTEMFGFPTSRRNYLSTYDQMSKVESTIHQFVRDWSAEGEIERNLTYTPILEKLEKYVPIHEGESKRVLIPGSGLSRLLFEVIKRGYGGQGNEFSYFMLLGSNYVLNSITEENSITIYPWINSPNNVVNTYDMYRPITIPDVCPVNVLKEGVDFSMCAGDFEECYAKSFNEWDSIITCFFIDTAPNVINYLEVIYHALKPGAYWINYGPLLYHWQTSEPIPPDQDDPRYEISIELSYEELQMVMKKIGFIMIEQERKAVAYTHNLLSMMGTTYDCVFFVVQKPFEEKKEE